MVHEPIASALFLLVLGLLLTIAVSVSRASAKLGVPVALAFLLVGIVAGSDGLGGIQFEDYELTFRVGVAAMALILFDGGLNTPVRAIRSVLWPAITMATVGVLVTAAITAVVANALGIPWPLAFLLGAIVSPTDAAAVFAVLSASGIRLKARVGDLLEVESGINDPMAVILVTLLTANILEPGGMNALGTAGAVVREMGVGAVVGYAIGRVALMRLNRMRLPAQGLFPAFTLGVAWLAYALPTLLHGSGFLGVYVAGVVVGSRPFPHAAGVRRVHDAIGWLSQIALFLILGLLVFPTRVATSAGSGLSIAIILAFVARPVAVWLCLAPFRIPIREIGYVGWVGLRGAVPVVLATIPVMAGVPESRTLFDLVFFSVVIGTLLPGATVPWVSRRFAMTNPAEMVEPAPMVVIDQPGGALELRPFQIGPNVATYGATIADVPFPDGAAVTVIDRGGNLHPPRPDWVLDVGDGVYILYRREDAQLIQLMFGPATED